MVDHPIPTSSWLFRSVPITIPLQKSLKQFPHPVRLPSCLFNYNIYIYTYSDKAIPELILQLKKKNAFLKLKPIPSIGWNEKLISNKIYINLFLSFCLMLPFCFFFSLKTIIGRLDLVTFVLFLVKFENRWCMYQLSGACWEWSLGIKKSLNLTPIFKFISITFWTLVLHQRSKQKSVKSKLYNSLKIE